MSAMYRPTAQACRMLRLIAANVCEREAERLGSLVHKPIYKKEPPTLSDEECGAILANWVFRHASGKAGLTIDPTHPARSEQGQREYEQLLIASRTTLRRLHRLEMLAGTVMHDPNKRNEQPRIARLKRLCDGRMRNCPCDWPRTSQWGWLSLSAPKGSGVRLRNVCVCWRRKTALKWS